MQKKLAYNTKKTYKTKNTLCFEISNHQKWFENSQLEIISQTSNNPNDVQTWIRSKLKYSYMLTQFIIKLIVT
jgi:hypothetical protein